MRDFKMSRVCITWTRVALKQQRHSENDWLMRILQYNFRMNALSGNIPGVKKAAW